MSSPAGDSGGRPGGAHPDRVRAALGRLAGVRASLDEEELTLIRSARTEGVPWRAIAAALGLGSAQGAWQRAHRLDRRNAGSQPETETHSADRVKSGRFGGRRLVVAEDPTSPSHGVGERIQQSLVRLLRAGESYPSLSVEQLLVDAGVARSTFYAYFGDKLAVLLLASRQAMAEVSRDAEGWSTLPDDATREDLRVAVRRIVVSYYNSAPVLAAMAESAAVDPRTRAEMRGYLNTARERSTRHALEQQKRGAVRQDVDVAVTMNWLLAMLEQGLYRFVRRAHRSDLDAHIDALTDVIWFALYAGAPKRA
jgi:TetR/AcrR family transcriptional regulator, ethionamide resistance regulator